jgi:hypothetical protein
VLLNGLDLAARGHEVKIVIEGTACRLVPEQGETVHPFYQHYSKTRERGLRAGICQACAQKTGSLEAARAQGLTSLADMPGHAGMAPVILDRYRIITF